jgi:hypothetical protein
MEPEPRSRFERAVDRLVADLPWGVLIFAAVAVLGLVWVAQGNLDHNDYLTAVGGGSGLLAIGHGIRTRR